MYSAEVIFNIGLCRIYKGDYKRGMDDILDAQKAKAVKEHEVIDEAVVDGAEGYTVFSIVCSRLIYDRSFVSD